MKYKLSRTRYLALVEEIPKSREFAEGTVFTKEGEINGSVFLKIGRILVCVEKKTLRNDFEAQWGKTSLFGEGQWS